MLYSIQYASVLGDSGCCVDLPKNSSTHVCRRFSSVPVSGVTGRSLFYCNVACAAAAMYIYVHREEWKKPALVYVASLKLSQYPR